jgi:excisionase family DNA binding protein
MSDEFLGTKDAARVLGVQPGTLEVWRSSGRYDLPFIKVGRCVRYRRADLDHWLASRTRVQTATPQLEGRPARTKIARRS